MKYLILLFFLIISYNSNCQSISIKNIFQLTQNPDSVSFDRYVTGQGFYYIRSFFNDGKHTIGYSNNKKIQSDFADILPGDKVAALTLEPLNVTVTYTTDSKTQSDSLTAELYQTGFSVHSKTNSENSTFKIFAQSPNARLQVIVATNVISINDKNHTWYLYKFIRKRG